MISATELAYRVTNALGVPQRLQSFELTLNLNSAAAQAITPGTPFAVLVTGPDGVTQTVPAAAVFYEVIGGAAIIDQGAEDSPALDVLVAPGQSVTLVFPVDPAAVYEDPDPPYREIVTNGLAVGSDDSWEPYGQPAWALERDTGGALVPAISLSVGSILAGDPVRELRPELLPGYRGAAVGDTPRKSGDGLVWGAAQAGNLAYHYDLDGFIVLTGFDEIGVE